MLKGADISHWNGKNAVRDILLTHPDTEFFMCKATEGKSFRDTLMATNYVEASSHGKLYGFYHFARPDNNTPIEEAKHFVNNIENYIGDCMLALDWEGVAHNYPIAWALDWLNAVYEMTGVRPLFYCQSSKLLKAECIKEANYGLWVAEWGKDKPNKAPWDVWAMWQTTNRPHDIDYFNGTKEQFRAYCKSDKVGETVSQDTPMSTCYGCKCDNCCKCERK